MKELSLHILDIAQNSLTAGATLVEISLVRQGGMLTVTIADNGCGMPLELAARAADPFATTRATRRLGLGLSLWKLAAEQAGGSFSLVTEEGKGARVTASFQAGHLDTPPPGDLPGTLATLIQGAPTADYVYCQGNAERLFTFDTRELRAALEEVPLSDLNVLTWLEAYLREKLSMYSVM